MLAERFSYEDVDVTGVLSENDGQMLLSVLTCVIAPFDEEDEEVVEDEESWDEEDDS
jgi:hypothetical protein